MQNLEHLYLFYNCPLGYHRLPYNRPLGYHRLPAYPCPTAHLPPKKNSLEQSFPEKGSPGYVRLFDVFRGNLAQKLARAEHDLVHFQQPHR